MRVIVFCHSLVSDWNHGNAHFLRGICSELLARGHAVDIYEPQDAWSLKNLLAEHGQEPLQGFARAYPQLTSERYRPETIDLDAVLANADLVLMHEWNEHAFVKRVGRHRRSHRHYQLLFHDTHHRSVTEPRSMDGYDLSHYDGVLAFGGVIRDLYLSKGWAQRAWTWHEAADTRVFMPRPGEPREGDLVWIGNWGDGERSAELREFLLDPVHELGLRARVHGVRYPRHALRSLEAAGIDYAGWLPNYAAPEVFARHAVTVHVPRRPYVQALPGIPTIRVFEALACGIPLVSAPWNDSEGLFEPGRDFLVARNGAEMRQQLRAVLNEPELAQSLVQHGLAVIHERHSCSRRVDELLQIHAELTAPSQARPTAPSAATDRILETDGEAR